MALTEIDETQLAVLQRDAKTLATMVNNPKTRRKVLEAFKENHPEASVPELDAAAPVVSRVEGIEKVVTDFIKETREEREKEKTEARLSKIAEAQAAGRRALKDRGYTEEGIKALEAFRDEKGLVDYADAITLWEVNHPAPQVAEPSGRPLNMFDMMQSDAEKDGFYKQLWESKGEDSGAVNRQALSAIAELRGETPRR